MRKHTTRAATVQDAAAICHIYNQGIAERTATFETRPRTIEEIQAWFNNDTLLLVVEGDEGILAFASATPYSPRACYAGIAQFSVYVDAAHRGCGAGRAALTALIDAAERAGRWKLIGYLFPENTASRSLMRALGFREVGTFAQHGRLNGVWRDTLIVEKLLTLPLNDQDNET